MATAPSTSDGDVLANPSLLAEAADTRGPVIDPRDAAIVESDVGYLQGGGHEGLSPQAIGDSFG